MVPGGAGTGSAHITGGAGLGSDEFASAPDAKATLTQLNGGAGTATGSSPGIGAGGYPGTGAPG
jgi:hypothetical protein